MPFVLDLGPSASMSWELGLLFETLRPPLSLRHCAWTQTAQKVKVRRLKNRFITLVSHGKLTRTEGPILNC